MKVDTLYIWILFTVILLFMIFGACIFNYLESDNEAKLKIEYYALFERFQKEHNISDEVIKTFLDVHLKASKLGVPCDGVTCDNVYKWNFIGSFFFSGTILTTVGMFDHYRVWSCFTVNHKWSSFLHTLCSHWYTIKYIVYEYYPGKINNHE